MRIAFFLLLALSLPLEATAQNDLRALQDQAARGDPAAQSSLGWRYHLGDGFPKDDQKALEFLRSAAAKGNATGMTNLADFYYRGIVVPRDLAKAADLNEQAASSRCGRGPTDQSCRSVLRGKVNLALMLAAGDGRPKNPKRAIELFKEALASGYGDTDAKIALAGMSINGEGMQPDPQLSIRLFKEVAATGDVDAARDLGNIYYSGVAGVPVDLQEARRWYSQAGLQDTGASAALAETLRREQDPLAASAQAQRQTLNKQRDEKAFKDAIAAVERRLEQRSAEHTKHLYYAVKAAGIRLGPVGPAIASANAGRRASGVWELKVDEQLDGPYLVTVVDFFERQPTFMIEGKGTYSAHGYLRDDKFRDSGRFAPDCKYQLYLGDRSKFYPCDPYLSGKLDDQVEHDLKEMLAADIKG